MDLDQLAQRAGLTKIWVKDESKRFNLNAFKVLGASFAFAKYILGSQEPLEYEDIVSKVQKVVIIRLAGGIMNLCSGDTPGHRH